MNGYLSNQHFSKQALSICRITLSVALRDKTISILAAMFISMVLISAYLGWSANHLIDAIYLKALPLLQAGGKLIPANPIDSSSPLSMLRNMSSYVSLLGALLSIVLGTQMIAEDRRSGIYPLIATRPLTYLSYALGKISALLLAILGLLLLALMVNSLSVLALPGAKLSPNDWLALLNFYAISWLFLSAFGLLGLAFSAWCRSETMGLVIPVACWLTLTFILPQLSANINPMAALNPIKAMVAPPSGAFFETIGPLLAPISITSTYRDIATSLLGFAPADASTSISQSAGILSLILSNVFLAGLSIFAFARLDATRSDTDE